MLDPTPNSFKPHLYFPDSSNDHQDSGVCSPPLWKTSPSTSPPHRNGYRSLSPSSKAQAIARGQRELMEMVSKMPESCYELSLKDLVEVNANELEERKVFDELPERTNKPNRVVKKMKSDKWPEKNRAGGMNNGGFLLKLGFPINLGSKKRSKKKKDDDSSVTSKGSWLSPRNSSVTSKGSWLSPRNSISAGSERNGDKDWWKNEFSESQGSESGISSNNSGSTKSSGSSSSSNRSRSNSIRANSPGCLSFLWKLHMRE
ncbi:PREDICTED: uncharacterized protein LOC104813698 [Tarenaya hassleriana]|uniref:uncharacterized protein LOC104813698 n=1 Tax=Tarenaya hassleriana TaxID=28532 RepID=UPI00053C2D6E|nr:PREDICTED: uncharacterized protein LOC104813698 [Tarenaya hassleriana]